MGSEQFTYFLVMGAVSTVLRIAILDGKLVLLPAGYLTSMRGEQVIRKYFADESTRE